MIIFERFSKISTIMKTSLENYLQSGLSHAPTLVITRHPKRFLSRKRLKNSFFIKKPGEFLKIDTDSTVDLRQILQKTLTSEAFKIFSVDRRHMFKVSRRSAYIRAFKRTNSRGHTTNRSKNFAKLRFFCEKTHAEIPF